jgi:hypothetical protein
MTPVVRSSDPKIKEARELICNDVLKLFQVEVPGHRLLCFVDDVDGEEFKAKPGNASNRGVFVPFFYQSVIRKRCPPLPYYVEELYGESVWAGNVYSSVLYVHGSTCEPRESLILTLSHELQHFTQFSQYLKSYYADFFLNKLLRRPLDIPSEHDALLTSKRVAIKLCGEKTVEDYARTHLSGPDGARWHYFLSLPLDDLLAFRLGSLIGVGKIELR